MTKGDRAHARRPATRPGEENIADNTVVYRADPALLTDDELVDAFAVRTGELEVLTEPLIENTDRPVNAHQIVMGSAGSGKTMLLRRLAVEVTRNEELNGWYYAVTLPEDHEIATVGEFWLGCLRQTAAQEDDASLAQKAAELHRIPASDDDTLEGYAIGALSDFSDRIDRRLVLLVDNIDQLFAALADADAGWKIRHVLQNEQRFALVGAASNRFDEIDRAEHALYQGLIERRLRPLTTDQCETLWSRVSGYPAGRPVMRTPIEMIAALTRGNARFVSTMARTAHDHPTANSKDTVLGVLDRHAPRFKARIEALPPKERRTYLALAALDQPASCREVAEHARTNVNNASSHLTRLTLREMVEVRGGSPRLKRYRVTEPLTALYGLVRTRRIRIKEIDRFVHEVGTKWSR